MDNPNFIASIAYTFENESRRNENRSDAPVNGSVNVNPPAWASFSLRKLWNGIRTDARDVKQAGSISTAAGRQVS